MVFNALPTNDDDHPRNHAIIAMNTDRRLSPAYDLTPSTPVGTQHRDLALTYGDHGRAAKAENPLSQCIRFHVEPHQARKLIDEMEQIVRSGWHAIARAEGVTPQGCERIRPAFAYERFRRGQDSTLGPSIQAHQLCLQRLTPAPAIGSAAHASDPVHSNHLKHIRTGRPVPEISRFFGVVITMYFNDHQPAHFHARYESQRARIRIRPPGLLDGYLSPRVLGLVIEWTELHLSELERNWTTLASEGTFERIAPLA